MYIYSKPLEVGLKVALTLRYLATGHQYADLEYQFYVAKNTINKFLPKVCKALLDEYSDEYLRLPSHEDEWRQIANNFDQKWNFPHCTGALDGKHVEIVCPANTNTIYHNYKGYFRYLN